MDESSRREFLIGRSLLKTVRGIAGRALDHDQDSSKQTGNADSSPGIAAAHREDATTYLLQVTRDAMACTFEVSLNAGQYEHGTDTALDVLDRIDRYERRLSVFKSDSEISRLNDSAFDHPVEVAPDLFELLQFCTQLYRDSGHAFDITSSPLWQLWGFARREGNVPPDDEIRKTLESIGSEYLRLDATDHSVQYLRQGLEINLGAIGKGFAIDQCVDELGDRDVNDFLIHAGGSSVAARGNRMGQQRPGWSIGVAHPMRHGKRMAEIWLCDEAIGTSGSGMQFFRHQGRRYSHILDPRTGRPAEGVVSVTVVAPTAQMADALSTAFFVMGPERSVEYCRSHQPLAMLMVVPVKHSPGFDIITHGLGEDQLVWHDAW